METSTSTPPTAATIISSGRLASVVDTSEHHGNQDLVNNMIPRNNGSEIVDLTMVKKEFEVIDL